MGIRNALLLCLLVLMLQLLLLSTTKHCPSHHLSPFLNQDGTTTTWSLSPFFCCCRIFLSSSPKVNCRTWLSPFFCCGSLKLNRRFFIGGMSFLQNFLNSFLLGDRFLILAIHIGMEFPSLSLFLVLCIAIVIWIWYRITAAHLY